MSLLFESTSWCLGLLDVSILLLRLMGRKRPKFFSEGWGDLLQQEEQQELLLKELAVDKAAARFNVDIEWEETKNEPTVTIRKGSFVSPLASVLPKESHYCHFSVVTPRNRTSASTTYIVMLPATGEVGSSARLRLAREFADEFGWSSCVVTAPYYGRRKPATQTLFLLNTVADLLMQGQVISQEAAILTRYFLMDPSAKVCITGFSFGAAMAAVGSSVALVAGCDGKRLACVPYIGSASPAVFGDGVLRTSVDWSALRGDTVATTEQLRGDLFDELYKTQLSIITEHIPKSNRIGVVRITASHHDHFIRRRYSHELIDQMEALRPMIKLPVEWLPGGHVVAAVLRPIYHRKAIMEAVKALQELQ